jgi:hypothetical protein
MSDFMVKRDRVACRDIFGIRIERIIPVFDGIGKRISVKTCPNVGWMQEPERKATAAARDYSLGSGVMAGRRGSVTYAETGLSCPSRSTALTPKTN